MANAAMMPFRGAPKAGSVLVRNAGLLVPLVATLLDVRLTIASTMGVDRGVGLCGTHDRDEDHFMYVCNQSMYNVDDVFQRPAVGIWTLDGSQIERYMCLLPVIYERMACGWNNSRTTAACQIRRPTSCDCSLVCNAPLVLTLECSRNPPESLRRRATMRA
ncbi:uncharacterized protein B0H18DRAFT_328955 [Fomitopsis serialis]|uniref:uncharacterized protein n=1 Tax=Fomitopsis serialis TaxID=139415 RepID=UPI002008C185|nr:uncharacterized protein B0H18DRAFT_328955 [Neoantrodia serialis]KAH9936669.1 hypothetical protein B0H18DRAFT_328955 [Neoantrodia serialis]